MSLLNVLRCTTNIIIKSQLLFTRSRHEDYKNWIQGRIGTTIKRIKTFYNRLGLIETRAKEDQKQPKKYKSKRSQTSYLKRKRRKPRLQQNKSSREQENKETSNRNDTNDE